MDQINLDYSLEIIGLISSTLLNHTTDLILFLFIGFIIGCILAFSLFKIIKSKRWFKRAYSSLIKQIVSRVLHFSFYLSIISLSSIGFIQYKVNSILEKETSTLVNNSLEYFKTNYFEDQDLMNDVFTLGLQIYSSGNQVNTVNEALAQAMVEMVSEKYGLGYLGSILFSSQKEEMIEQIESIEKALIYIVFGKLIEYSGTDFDIDTETIDSAFNTWLATDYEYVNQDLETFLTHQITVQLKPITFAFWMPLIVINVLVLLTVVSETVYYKRINP